MSIKPETGLSHDPSTSFVAKIIDLSVKNSFFVLLGALVILSAGILSIKEIPLDAIPDLSDTQVIIRTDFSGQAPQVVEDQITFPLSAQMLGLPKTKVVRGYSMFGTSFVIRFGFLSHAHAHSKIIYIS